MSHYVYTLVIIQFYHDIASERVMTRDGYCQEIHIAIPNHRITICIMKILIA